jgi:peroxiredoxin
MQPEYEAAGATSLAISPQLGRLSRELVAGKRLAFEILHDAGGVLAAEAGLRFALPEDLREVYRGFGIDLARANGEPSWTLPMPARYVLDRDGVVRSAAIDPDYTRRPEPEDTLRDLRELRD